MSSNTLQLRDAAVGSCVSSGAWHPSAPAGRPVGIQLTKWNQESREFESIVVYATVDEACVIAEDLAAAIQRGRLRIV